MLIALIVVMAIASSLFLTIGNLLNTSRFYVEPGLIALGMTLVIVTGGIDLSVGASLALVSVVIGFAFGTGVPLWLRHPARAADRRCCAARSTASSSRCSTSTRWSSRSGRSRSSAASRS